MGSCARPACAVSLVAGKDRRCYRHAVVFNTLKSRRLHEKRLLRAVTAAAHLVLVFAVLFGIAQSGRRYFYCEAFGLLPSDPCRQGSSTVEGNRSPGMLSEDPADCCEVVTLGAMPEAAQASRPSVAPAAQVALVPARSLRTPIAFAPPPCVDREFERWRPPPRASRDLRAQLMVFLT